MTYGTYNSDCLVRGARQFAATAVRIADLQEKSTEDDLRVAEARARAHLGEDELKVPSPRGLQCQERQVEISMPAASSSEQPAPFRNPVSSKIEHLAVAGANFVRHYEAIIAGMSQEERETVESQFATSRPLQMLGVSTGLVKSANELFVRDRGARACSLPPPETTTRAILGQVCILSSGEEESRPREEESRSQGGQARGGHFADNMSDLQSIPEDMPTTIPITVGRPQRLEYGDISVQQDVQSELPLPEDFEFAADGDR